jgi:hypothetical protein
LVEVIHRRHIDGSQLRQLTLEHIFLAHLYLTKPYWYLGIEVGFLCTDFDTALKNGNDGQNKINMLNVEGDCDAYLQSEFNRISNFPLTSLIMQLKDEE